MKTKAKMVMVLRLGAMAFISIFILVTLYAREGRNFKYLYLYRLSGSYILSN